MKNEKVHRRRALFALEAIEVCATSCRKDWKGRTQVRDEKARRKLETLSGGKFHERLNMYAANFAEAHKAGRVTDQEFADGITVGIWIGACLAHVRIEWQDIEEIKEQE